MKINHFLAGAGFLALALIIGHSVSAADLRGSLKDSYTDSVDDAPKGWSGPYIGIGAGISSQEVEESHVEEYPHEPKYGHSAKGKGKGKQFGVVTTTEDEDDWLLTARIGYDWQRGPIVWGLFTDINYYGGGNDSDFSLAPGARLGWLLTPGWLAYINGGVELRDGSGSDGVDPFIGGGMEWVLRDGWSMNIEPRVILADDNGVDDAKQIRFMLFRRF